MDRNSLFDPEDSSNSDGESYIGAASVVLPTPRAAILQTVNIKSHVPVVLVLADANYDEWRCFMDAFLGKFNLNSHVSKPLIELHRRDPD
jgi:hypothetical protein